MDKSGIYIIENIINGKSYVGSAEKLDRRFKAHFNKLKCNKHENQRLQNAFNKYGVNSFEFRPIFIVENTEDLIYYEQKFINELKPEYNICLVAGNTLGFKHSQESKDKMPKAVTGRKLSPERCAQMSEIMKLRHKNNPFSEETRLKLSNSQKGKPKSSEHLEKIWENRRKNGTDKHTEESKLKISQGLNRNPNLSEAHKGQIPWNKGKQNVQIAWNKGKSPSEAARQNMRIGQQRRRAIKATS